MNDDEVLEPVAGRRPGRQPATSHSQIEHVAFELFERKGFDETTIDDIAAAVGIARRTFFRYFPSKNDIVWGTFDEELEHLAAGLRRFPADVGMMQAIRLATLEFNRVDTAELPWHRRRLALILQTPALQAHSTIRFRAWKDVIAAYSAERLDVAASSLAAQGVGYASLAMAIAAYEAWLATPGSELGTLLDEAFACLSAGFPQS